MQQAARQGLAGALFAAPFLVFWFCSFPLFSFTSILLPVPAWTSRRLQDVRDVARSSSATEQFGTLLFRLDKTSQLKARTLDPEAKAKENEFETDKRGQCFGNQAQPHAPRQKASPTKATSARQSRHVFRSGAFPRLVWAFFGITESLAPEALWATPIGLALARCTRWPLPAMGLPSPLALRLE